VESTCQNSQGPMVQRGRDQFFATSDQSSSFVRLPVRTPHLAHDISRNPLYTVTNLNPDRFRRSLGKSFNCFQTTGLFTPGVTTRFFGPPFEGRIFDPELQIEDYQYSRVDDLSTLSLRCRCSDQGRPKNDSPITFHRSH